MPTVLIIGAGIGGLTATLALRRAGFEVQIFESVSEIKIVGAGLAIWCNALRPLSQVGAAQGIRAVGKPAVYRVIRATSGTMLTRVEVRAISGEEGESLLHLHRGDLQNALLQAVG